MSEYSCVLFVYLILRREKQTPRSPKAKIARAAGSGTAVTVATATITALLSESEISFEASLWSLKFSVPPLVNH
jgi:hypothetical protein